MSKHTPGPWRLNTQGNTLRGAADHFVCDMNDVRAANARLIAAAPELLEALQMLRSACNGVRPFAGTITPLSPDINQVYDGKRFMDAIAFVDAAIAKAEEQT